MQRRSFIRATGAVAATIAMPRVFSQEWPNAPVRIVVGFPPGGGTDALARVISPSEARESSIHQLVSRAPRRFH